MQPELSVRDLVTIRKQGTALGNVIAMPAAKAVETKKKTPADRKTVTMPLMVANAGHRFMRHGGSIERFRQAEGITRRQAVELLFACIFAEYGTPRRAA